MTEKLVVVGAGGFGREVLDVVDAINAADDLTWSVIGVVDDSPSVLNLERLAVRGVKHIGSVDDVVTSTKPAAYVVGIGSPRVRRIVTDRFDAAGWTAATLIHPSSTLGFDVRVGEGTVICAGARLTTNIELGRHVHLNLNATIGHDCLIGDFVSINPLAAISGDCVIEDEVLVGVAGVTLNGVTLGTRAVLGGSACAVRDISAGVVAVGVPANPMSV